MYQGFTKYWMADKVTLYEKIFYLYDSVLQVILITVKVH